MNTATWDYLGMSKKIAAHEDPILTFLGVNGPSWMWPQVNSVSVDDDRGSNVCQIVLTGIEVPMKHVELLNAYERNAAIRDTIHIRCHEHAMDIAHYALWGQREDGDFTEESRRTDGFVAFSKQFLGKPPKSPPQIHWLRLPRLQRLPDTDYDKPPAFKGVLVSEFTILLPRAPKKEEPAP